VVHAIWNQERFLWHRGFGALHRVGSKLSTLTPFSLPSKAFPAFSNLSLSFFFSLLSLLVDDERKVDLPVGLGALIVLNLPNYAGGADLWGADDDPTVRHSPSLFFQLIEIFCFVFFFPFTVQTSRLWRRDVGNCGYHWQLPHGHYPSEFITSDSHNSMPQIETQNSQRDSCTRFLDIFFFSSARTKKNG
jgi:hypothetical protein